MSIPSAELSPTPLAAEFQLLCRCARSRLEDSTIETIERRLRGPVDFDELVRAAQCHGVMPLLHHSLSAISPGLVPDQVWHRLGAHCALNRALNRALACELISVLELFRDNGIPALPFKGPLLAQTIYGSLALRKAGDLDILIRQEDAFRAADLLGSVRYLLKTPLPLVPSDDELHLERDDGRAVIELRWRAASRNSQGNRSAV